MLPVIGTVLAGSRGMPDVGMGKTRSICFATWPARLANGRGAKRRDRSSDLWSSKRVIVIGVGGRAECRTGRTLPATGDGSSVRLGSGSFPSQCRPQSHSIRHTAGPLRCGADIGHPPCGAWLAGAEVLSVRTRPSADSDAGNADGFILRIRGFACTSLPYAACSLSGSRPRTYQWAVQQPLFSTGKDFSTKSPENLQQISKFVAAWRRIFAISLMARERR